MVRSCLVCKTAYRSNPDLTFHIFPSNQNMKMEWFRAIDRDFEGTKFIYLCSNHFRDSDFIEKFGGRYLKKNTVPVMSTGSNRKETCERFPAVSEPSTVVPVCSMSHKPVKEGKHSRKVPLSPSIPSTTSVDSPIKSPTRVLSIMESTENACQSSSNTFTVIKPQRDIEPPSSVKRRFRKPRYIGECDDCDWIIINWKKAKKTIDLQRQRIRFLEHRNRKMKSRVSCLESLLAHLRPQNLVSETFDSAINASFPRPARGIMKRVLKGSTKHKYTSEL